MNKPALPLFLLIWMTTIPTLALSGQDRGDNGRFIGAWRLVSLEEQGPDGKPHKVDCTGLLAYTRDGHMSVQVMARNPQAGTAYMQDGYESSYGRYEIDERSHTFTYRVEGALVRTLIGKDLVRGYEISGNQLIVTPSNPNEHWRVVWEHY